MVFRGLVVVGLIGVSVLANSPAFAQSNSYVCIRNPNNNTSQWVRLERVYRGQVTAGGTFYLAPRARRQIRTGPGRVRYCWGYTRNAVAGGCRPGYISWANKGYCGGGGSGGPPPGGGGPGYGGPGYGGGGGGAGGAVSCFRNTNTNRGGWFRIENVRGGRVVSANNFYIAPGQVRRFRVPYGNARWCWAFQRNAIAGGCRPGYSRPVVRNNC